MDPLGAKPPTVSATELTCWAATGVDGAVSTYDSMCYVVSPFSVNKKLNKKVALWTGDIASLQVEAVVNPTNEGLTDKNPISQRLNEVAGPELREECRTQVGNCRTGEARITAAYGLPARHVIHTVGPRFNLRYKTAAESALYNCYRSVMQIVRSRHLATVAFSVLNSSRRGYPGDEGAHIAIRTIRRFLEHFGEGIDLVIFVTDGKETWYKNVMPLYFPRTKEEEEIAANSLPADLGDEFGEPIIQERKIRISNNPLIKENSTNNGSSENNEDVSPKDCDHDDDDMLISAVGRHPFSNMTDDQDSKRKVMISRSRPPTEEENQAKIYEGFLKRAQAENFQDMANLGVFYTAGLDYMGRQIVVFVGKQFPASKIDLSKAMAFFLHVMESVVNKDYILVYFHTKTVPDNYPETNFYKQLYAMVDSRYKSHLRALYIIHPSLWLKVSAWWFLMFTASEIKDRVHYLTGVQFLYDTVNPDQIVIPQFILQHDKEVNGTNYYVPASRGDEATGGL